ncbi:hypothetical protein [Cellulomonas chitinilytica]|uniref:hypothetical protein n=1 Tax=Cellulomonas chitinilytica TaxID=398759 RepID=UPI001941C87A|nr:hypothetical protein [Cellulomonas chitinilytica]
MTVPAGRLLEGLAMTCGAHRYVRDVTSYDAWHDRLGVQLGSAREHACVDCGRPARHWSLDVPLDDPRTLTTPGGYRYVLDTDAYRPRCPACHAAHDVLERRLARRAAQRHTPPPHSRPTTGTPVIQTLF